MLMCMARVVNNKFIKTDPIISQFNEHEHFLRIVVEAFSEYVLEISQTGSDYHNSTHFLQVAERNICFLICSRFLRHNYCRSIGTNHHRQGTGTCGLRACGAAVGVRDGREKPDR